MKTILPRFAIIAAAMTAMATPACGGAAETSAITVIRAGSIYTGGAGPSFTGDVVLRDDRIVYVGRRWRGHADRVIDARGKIVAPGLIDAHAHPDTYIRSPQAAQRVNAPWLRQGVSTLVIGVDGFGTPDIERDAGSLARSGIGTNIVPLIGFGAIRERVIGESARAPNPAELTRMKRLVAQGMCEGAVGFSTGLFYPPQSYATTDEVIALAQEAAIRGGLYDTHQRDESDYTIGVLASTREVLRIGREAHIPVHFAHLKVQGVDVEGKAPQLIAMIDAARRAGQEVTADQYPYLASGTSIDGALIPRWADEGGFAKLLERLGDPATRAAIRAAIGVNLGRRGGPASLLLISPGLPWTGKTLAEIATLWQVAPQDAAIRILQQTRLTPDGAPLGDWLASFSMSEPDVEAIMKQQWVVTSSDGSDGHPRQYATFPMKYRSYVMDRNVIDLAFFIRQSTGATADIYKLDRRGYLRPGYFADVVVIDPQRYAPRADYVHPAVLSVGIDALFVNGRLAVDHDRVTGAAAGRALLRPPPGHCPA